MLTYMCIYIVDCFVYYVKLDCIIYHVIKLHILGMELVGESSHQKKRRITWKKEGLVQTFLEVCLHETIKNGREGSSLKPV